MFLEVVKRINNNVVLVSQGKKRMIVTGKGVGFKVYPGDVINEKFIEQRFRLEEEQDSEYYVELLKEIPMEILALSEKVVEKSETIMNKKLSGNLIFALADHLCFAIDRVRKGLAIEHPLAWEIKQFYPKEMEVGKHAVELVRAETGLSIPDGEAVFVAMHIVNAVGGLSDFYDANELTDMMITIVKRMEDYLSITIDQTTTAFTRFITHLRYYLVRQLKMEIDESVNDELVEIVKEKYPDAFGCAEMISDYLDEHYANHSSDDEKLYLTLHINRLLDRQ